MDARGEAPVPPSLPEICTKSAKAFTTPAAIVPTPASDTSLTPTCARLFTRFRS